MRCLSDNKWISTGPIVRPLGLWLFENGRYFVTFYTWHPRITAVLWKTFQYIISLCACSLMCPLWHDWFSTNTHLNSTWLSQVACDVTTNPVSDEPAVVACPREFVWLTWTGWDVSVIIWQTGWMERYQRTMSHNQAVDFTAKLCIPDPTMESRTQHPLQYTEHRLCLPGRGPSLVLRSLEKTRSQQNRLLKNWNLKALSSWSSGLGTAWLYKAFSLHSQHYS